MRCGPLKLKQASAVLETSPKELQNLVQFGVVSPRRKAGLFVFDLEVLYAAKIALFLKKALGTNTEMLSAFVQVLTEHLRSLPDSRQDVIVFKSRPAAAEMAIEVIVPFRKLTRQVEERMKVAELYQDLPRGRKRPGWKAEFLATLQEAAKDMAIRDSADVANIVRTYRAARRRKTEVTIETTAKTAGLQDRR